MVGLERGTHHIYFAAVTDTYSLRRPSILSLHFKSRVLFPFRVYHRIKSYIEELIIVENHVIHLNIIIFITLLV